MSFQSINLVNVHYCQGDSPIPMGRLALKNRKIFFEYAPDFLELSLELSPFKLPLKSGLMVCEDPVFDGLFGVFNDSLPDGWGRLLLDRKLQALGINPKQLTPLDRLCYVGSRGMGALFYAPETEPVTLLSALKNFDDIAEECLQFQVDDNEEYIDELLVMNGSSLGARPKILVSLKDKNITLSQNQIFTDHDDWIIKFCSSYDPKDAGAIEYAYHLMAIQAGLDVPDAKLFNSKKCPGYFGVKRFDRMASKFFHMHTVSGLLHLDHRLPVFDYETLMKVTLRLTKDITECEKQFRHAVFNVFSHNRDDHLKNFSFVMDGERWKVSPAYDLTFSVGPVGEHCTTVMGEGKNPDTSHLLALAESAGIEKQTALEIIEQVKKAISCWKMFADEAGVGKVSSKNIATRLMP